MIIDDSTQTINNNNENSSEFPRNLPPPLPEFTLLQSVNENNNINNSNNDIPDDNDEDDLNLNVDEDMLDITHL